MNIPSGEPTLCQQKKKKRIGMAMGSPPAVSCLYSVIKRRRAVALLVDLVDIVQYEDKGCAFFTIPTCLIQTPTAHKISKRIQRAQDPPDDAFKEAL